MVIATAESGVRPVERNWNAVPTGMLRHTPAVMLVTEAPSESRRHISPSPPRMYQSSSTVRWATAIDTRPGAQLEVRHRTAGQAEEDADVGAVRRYDVRCVGQQLCFEAHPGLQEDLAVAMLSRTRRNVTTI
jgi:hypothetical protein